MEVSSDGGNFIAVYQGTDSGDKVYAQLILNEDDVSVGDPPSAPVLVTPDDGVTFAPIRAYLSWEESIDPEGGAVTYNVYFGEDAVPGNPQFTGLTGLNFVIGPENEPNTGITLEANKTYQWKIEAQDEDGNRTSSEERILNTDDSVIAWYRLDEDPAGAVCPGGSGGQTVCDYSGNDYHGTPFGNPNWIAPGMPDVLGGALEFDGVNDKIHLEDIPTAGMPEVSVITTARQDTLPTGGFPFHIIFNKEFVVSLTTWENGGTTRITFNTGDGNGWYSGPNPLFTGPINLGQKYRVLADYGAGGGRIFLDGVMEANGPFGGGANVGAGMLIPTIGNTETDSFEFYDGNLQEVIVLNRTLSDDDVSNDFQSADAAPPPTPGPTPDPTPEATPDPTPTPNAMDTGWVFPMSGNEDSSIGDAGWGNPGGITDDDGSVATSTFGDSESPSRWLVGQDFNFNGVPDNAVVVGIEVEIERSDKSSQMLMEDDQVRLFNNGQAAGDNKAKPGGYPASLTATIYGGSFDDWGLNLSGTDIKQSDFGVGLSVKNESGNSAEVQVDYVRMRVYYVP